MDNQYPEQPERDFWAEWRDMNDRHYQEYQQWFSQFQQWQAEQQRQADERQRQELERQRTEENGRREDQQRQADERKAQDDHQREADRQREEQRQRDDQKRQEADRRKQQEAERTISAGEKPHSITPCEQAMYEEYNRYLRKESTSITDRKYGLDRHDFYNIDTAHELESAMLRAELQGVNVRNEKQFQKFLDREAAEGINQREGKRPLNERYQELCQKRDTAVHQLHRGIPSEMVAPIKLYENGWEQRYRMEKEQQTLRENVDWQRHLESQQIERDSQRREEKSILERLR